MGSLSLETLSTMLRIYSNGYTESTMKNFIDVTNKIRWANYITRKTSNTFKDFITRIVTNF